MIIEMNLFAFKNTLLNMDKITCVQWRKGKRHICEPFSTIFWDYKPGRKCRIVNGRPKFKSNYTSWTSPKVFISNGTDKPFIIEAKSNAQAEAYYNELIVTLDTHNIKLLKI